MGWNKKGPCCNPVLLQQLNGSQENGMSLNGAYITFPKRKGM